MDNTTALYAFVGLVVGALFVFILTKLAHKDDCDCTNCTTKKFEQGRRHVLNCASSGDMSCCQEGALTRDPACALLEDYNQNNGEYRTINNFWNAPFLASQYANQHTNKPSGTSASGVTAEGGDKEKKTEGTLDNAHNFFPDRPFNMNENRPVPWFPYPMSAMRGRGLVPFQQE